MNLDLKKIIDLRIKLHRLAELQGQEHKTTQEIKSYLEKLNPDDILNLNQTAFAIVFDSKNPGLTVAFNAYISGDEINEPKDFVNHSLSENISHKSGNDGHIAILCGLAEEISNNRPETGKVVLIFSPFGQTGTKNIVHNEDFLNLDIDYIFGFRNLPKFSIGSIIFKNNNFNASNKKISIKFIAKATNISFAGEAKSLIKATFTLLNYFESEINRDLFLEIIKVSPTYINIGKQNSNITPNQSEIQLDLYSLNNEDKQKLFETIQEQVGKIAYKNELKYKISEIEEIPQVLSNKNLMEVVFESAIENDIPLIELSKPQLWSDEFGYFSDKFKCAYLGFGNGDTPQIGEQMYDFNDNIITPAINLLYSIYTKTNKSYENS